MPIRWKSIVAYDGTGFNGWQSQVGGNTIQDIIEKRFEVIVGCPVRVHGSGRTDSGVHAKGQVFHFDAEWNHSTEHLLRALQSGIPSSIRVKSVSQAVRNFHARYSARGKRYSYRFFEGLASPFDTRYFWSLGNMRLDVALMNEAASTLLGEHDFSSFTANRSDGSEENPVKNLKRLEVKREGRRLRMTTEAGGYLYKMVRTLAGALVEVGIGKLKPDELSVALEGRKRTGLIPTAPAHGLCLERVFY